MPLYEKAGAWLIDYGYMLRGTLSMVIHREPPQHYLGHVVEERAPVILIPGVLNKWGFMKHLGDTISRLGHPVYIVPELGYNISSIPASAKILRALIEKENMSGAILVAHSKGGLIGKYLLAHHNTGNRVLGMVAIASPFSGSAMTELFPQETFKELRTDSDIIKDLEQHRSVNEKIISIIPEYDNHVWADQGSFLDGAFENVEVPIQGHHKVLFSGIVLQTVLDSIEKISRTNQTSQSRSTAL